MESSYDARTVPPSNLFSETQETTVPTQAVPPAGKLRDASKPPIAISFGTYYTQGSLTVLVKQPPLPKQPNTTGKAGPNSPIPKNIDTPTTDETWKRSESSYNTTEHDTKTDEETGTPTKKDTETEETAC